MQAQSNSSSHRYRPNGTSNFSCAAKELLRKPDWLPRCVAELIPPSTLDLDLTQDKRVKNYSRIFGTFAGYDHMSTSEGPEPVVGPVSILFNCRSIYITRGCMSLFEVDDLMCSRT